MKTTKKIVFIFKANVLNILPIARQVDIVKCSRFLYPMCFWLNNINVECSEKLLTSMNWKHWNVRDVRIAYQDVWYHVGILVACRLKIQGF